MCVCVIFSAVLHLQGYTYTKYCLKPIKLDIFSNICLLCPTSTSYTRATSFTYDRHPCKTCRTFHVWFLPPLMVITELSFCLIQATLTLQVSYIPPPGCAPIFQPPHPPEALPHSNPTVEMDTVTSNKACQLLSKLSSSSIFGIICHQCVCLSSDFSGHTGRGGYGEHDDAGADGGSGSRWRALHGHHRQSGAFRPRVTRRPGT